MPRESCDLACRGSGGPEPAVDRADSGGERSDMQVMIDLPEDLARELEPKREDLADIIRRGLRLPPLSRLSVVEEVFEFCPAALHHSKS